jgi:hypothetical protein
VAPASARGSYPRPCPRSDRSRPRGRRSRCSASGRTRRAMIVGIHFASMIRLSFRSWNQCRLYHAMFVELQRLFVVCFSCFCMRPWFDNLLRWETIWFREELMGSLQCLLN